jgi:methyl-accepting chemotaxis protein
MFKRRFTLIKNFSITARLHSAGVLALIGVGITAYAGFTGLQSSNAGLKSSIMATTAVLNQKHADMMHDALRADVLYAMQVGPSGSIDERQAISDDLAEHLSEFEESIATLNGLDLNAEIRAAVDSTIPAMDIYTASASDLVATAFADSAAATEAYPRFMEHFSNLEVQMGTLGELIEKVGNSAGQTTHDENEHLLQVILYTALACGLFMLLSNLYIGVSITKPIRRVKRAIQEITQGNLDGRFSSFDRASDLNDDVSAIGKYLEVLRVRLREAIAMEAEIKASQQEQSLIVDALSLGLEHLAKGDLTQPIRETFSANYEALRQNYNRTIQQLNETMTMVVDASRSINARADDITQSSNDLAHRTESQAATLEETAAALDELTSSVKTSAASARDVENVVQQARHEAAENGKIVQKAVEAMEGIERSSEQIAQIIGVIEDIAFQTNLLALNAGVEAARAGESGRGFAVVASEVRALAQRSSDASKEINELIRTSRQLVATGVDSVGNAGTSLSSLFDRVIHISKLVSTIAQGAQQQSVALAEVNVGVGQLDQVTQRNAAMVDESKAATAALRQEAVSMSQLVSHFETQAGQAWEGEMRVVPRPKAA